MHQAQEAFEYSVEELAYISSIKEMQDLFPTEDECWALAAQFPPPQEWYDSDFDPTQTASRAC